MNPESFVYQTLTDLGFSPIKIEEKDSETPDFIIKAEDGVYLIEQKTKFDDNTKLKEKNKILRSGSVYEESTSISYQKSAAKRIRKASKQLTALDVPVDYRIVWLMAHGSNSDLQMKQFKMTLYGSVNLIDLNESSNTMRTCFYFSESSFFKNKDRIDAAVISTLEKCQLCINNYSPNYELFRQSGFCMAFGSGVVDPIELEANNNAYIADCGLNRSDKSKILKFVQQKYGRPRLIDLNFTSYSASVLVPSE